MNFAKAVLGCSLLAACAHEGTPKEQLRSWNHRHPAAAQELCAWTAQHPRASDRLLTWEGNNGGRAEEVLRWAASNPGYGWETLAAQRPEMKDFAVLASQHPRAANQLLDWQRRYPDAAQDLLEHQEAVRFAGRRSAC
jgi:hypothetical protein